MSATTIQPGTAPVRLARRARHRKPNRRPHVITAALGIITLVALIAGSVAAGHLAHRGQAFAGIPGMAPAAVQHTQAPASVTKVQLAAVNWTARTCAAFAAWQRHPSAANLDAMMADSFRVPWKYVGEDAAGLYADVRGGGGKYVSKDEKYFAQDCR